MPGRAAFALRRTRPRHFLMCPPTYFDVRYAINPWMDPHVPVDRPLALAQWSALVEAYRAAGHHVDLLTPVPGLPDMVYAANGAFALDGIVLPARFAYAERAPEAAAHAEWHRRNGTGYAGPAIAEPAATNEAEGDFAVLSDRILAGYGFRTSRAAHGELAALTGREVISLELVDSRLYHLDVALTVLDDERDHIAYYPDAFSPDSQAAARRALPGCDPGHRDRRVRLRPELRQRRPQRLRPRRARRTCARRSPRRATGRFRSTSASWPKVAAA